MSLLHLDCKDATPAMSFTQPESTRSAKRSVEIFFRNKNIDLFSKHLKLHERKMGKLLLDGKNDLFPIFTNKNTVFYSEICAES